MSVEQRLKSSLVCGLLSSLLYAAMNAFVPMGFNGYSLTSQTVSELSAIGAPTRPLWVGLGAIYSLLVIACAWGVWKSAGRNRPLRVVGGLLVVDGIVSLYWPPMHLRGADFTLTDTMHIVWAAVTVLLMMFAIGFGAAAFGKRFRLYSPTPWVGIWERINIAAFIVWVVALAMLLLRDRASKAVAHQVVHVE